MNDFCHTVLLSGIVVQENGIIRNTAGRIIGRLVSDVDFKSAHIQPKEPFGMAMARQEAAKAWCTPNTSCKEMDAELAEEFALIINRLTSEPWLGNATNNQMLEELQARGEAGGYSEYKTTGEEVIIDASLD